MAALSMEESVNCLVECITQTHSPHASMECRETSLMQIEAFKTSSALMQVEMAMHIIPYEHGYSPIVRHFGLQLLDNVIRCVDWETFEGKAYMKESSLKLIERGTYGILEEKGFVKEKIAWIVSEIAKREWPQQWPSLTDDLVRLAELGSVQSELVVFVFRTLVEGIQQFTGDLSPARCKALQGALREISKPLLVFFGSIISKGVTGATERTPETPEELKVFLKLATGGFRGLAAMLDWISLEDIKQNGLLELLTASVRVVGEIEARYSSVEATETLLQVAECVLIMVGERRDHDLLFCYDVFAQMTPALTSNIHRYSTSLTKESTHTVMKRFAQSICAMATNLLAPLVSSLNSPPPELEAFSQLLLGLTQHKSDLMSSFALPAWCILYRVPVAEYPMMKAMVMPLLTALAPHAEKLILNKNGNPVLSGERALFAAMDAMDDDEELLPFISDMRTKVREVIRVIAANYPDQAFGFMLTELSTLVEATSKSATEFGNQPATLKITKSSPLFRHWDGFTLVAKSITGALKEHAAFDAVMSGGGEVTDIFDRVFASLLAIECREPLVLRQLLAFIADLAIVGCANDPEKLWAIIERLLDKGATFVMPGATPMSSEALSVRSATLSSLHGLCRAIPTSVLPLLDNLAAKVGSMLNANLLMDTEQASLMEALVFVVNKEPSEVRRERVVSDILNMALCTLSEPEFVRSMSNTKDFLEAAGLSDFTAVDRFHRGASVFSERHEHWRKRALASVQIIMCVHRACQPILSPAAKQYVNSLPTRGPSRSDYLMLLPLSELRFVCESQAEAILLLILPIISSLHGVWTVSGREILPPFFQSVLEMPCSTRQQLLSARQKSDDDTHSENAVLRSPRAWLNMLRDFSYATVNVVLCQGNLCADPRVGAMLAQSLFSNIEVLEIPHFISLLRGFIRPFTGYVATRMPEPPIATLDAFLPQFFTSLFNRTITEWQHVQSVASLSEAGNEDEIIRDRLIRELSRLALTCIHVILTTPNPTKMLKSPTSPKEVVSTSEVELSRFSMYALGNNEMAYTVARMLCASFSLPDAVAVRKSLETIRAVVPFMMRDDPWRSFVISDMFSTIIKGLSLHGEHSDVLQPSIGVLIIICQHAAMHGVEDKCFSILAQIPKAERETVTSFAKLFKNVGESTSAPGVKRQRSELMKLLTPICSVNVGQRHRANVARIRDLPGPAFLRIKEMDTTNCSNTSGSEPLVSIADFFQYDI